MEPEDFRGEPDIEEAALLICALCNLAGHPTKIRATVRERRRGGITFTEVGLSLESRSTD